MSNPFTVEFRGPLAVFCICRPQQANALNRPVLLGLGAFARECGANPQVRALVVTAEGPRHFCAGADLKERAGWTQDDVRAQLELYRTELGALDACPKPVVGAINGTALGGGLEIALACDLRVAAASATFGLPEVTLGIIPAAGGTQRLTRIVGEARAKELILLARRLDAQQALSWGIVNRIAQGDLLQDTGAWLQPIIDGAPLAHAAALRAIDAAGGGSIEHGLAVERQAYESLLPTADRQEGLAAFADKRKPSYRGS